MTTATLEKTALKVNRRIVKVLEETMNLYRQAINMDYEEGQRLILRYLQTLFKNHKEFASIKEACDIVLDKYPKGMPQDSTLIQEAMKLVEEPTHKNVFPQTWFEEDILMFKMHDFIIEQLFGSIPKEALKKKDQVIVSRLWDSVHNILVENSNFKGDNPYYKQNYHEMDNAKKIWIESLDECFNVYLDYYKEEATF